MAWPPTIPPATRSNTTPELDNHALDHNQASEALTAIVDHVNAVSPVEVQWGYTAVSTDSDGLADVTYPTPFTSTPVMVICTPALGTSLTLVAFVRGRYNDRFTVAVHRNNAPYDTGGGTVGISWWAARL